MTGKDLHQLLLNKWGRSYDNYGGTQHKVFVQIMWKYLSKFFPSPSEYQAHLDTIASYVYAFGGRHSAKIH